MSDFMESIFDSIKIIVDKELGELAFDTTIICRIIDDSNSKNGKYKVTDGSITFDAYSELSDYQSGESVRVTVPNNDYSQKKFIIGKYVEDEKENNAPITYVSQTDSVVDVSGNLIDWDNEIKATGIIMNGPQSKVLVWEKDFGEKFKYVQNSDIYNTLLLKVDFQTFMESYQITEGSYGLSIELFIFIPEIGEYIKKTAIFSNSEMFGNTYSFKIPSTQSKVFPLTIPEGIIQGIKISLHQDNNFKDQNGQLVDYPIDSSTGEKIFPQLPHIQINNLQLGFGSNIVGISDNILKIYSPNSLDYNYYLHDISTNQKKIGLVWYNKNEFDKYLGFSDGYYDPDYDEIEYLRIAKSDNRLAEQQQKENMPSDQCGLWLAADLAELGALINEVGTLITSKLYTQLFNLNEKIKEISNHLIPINPDEPVGEENGRALNALLNDFILKVSPDRVDPIKKQFTEDQDLYIKLLECVSKQEAYKIIEEVDTGNGEDSESVEKDIDLTTFTLPDLNRFSTTYIDDSLEEDDRRLGFNGILNEVNTILETLQNDLNIYFPSYLGVYDAEKIRINRVITEIKRTLNRFPIVNILNSYPTNKIHNYRNISYQDYLLYYTYQAQGKFPTGKPKQVLDILFKREIGEGETEINLPDYSQMNLDMYNQKYCIYWYKYNTGYQASDEYAFLGENWQRLLTYDNIGRPVITEGPIPTMNPIFGNKDDDMIEEYMDPNMQQQKYKAVLFYNHIMYVSNELIFTNIDEIPNTVAIDKADGLEIEHLENSFDSYFLYSGSSNNLWDISHASQIRQLRCHFKGLRLGDELLYGARIYWYIPESSMLTYNKEWLMQKGFATDLDELEDTKQASPYYRPGYVCFSKMIQDINITSEEESSEESGEESSEFITDESFMRDEGSAPCDTRDFWYQIQNSYEPTGKTHIICMVIPKDSEIYYETKIPFSFGLMGTNGTHHTLSVINKGLCPAIRKFSSLEDDGSLIVKVELRDVNNEKIDISLINTEENFVAVKEIFQACDGFPVIYDASDQDGTLRLEDDELKLVANTTNPSSAIIEVSLKDYDIGQGKTVSLSSIHPIPWSKDYYYLSGTTRIVYNSLGVLDTNVKFDREYHLYNINNDVEVVDTTEVDENSNPIENYLNWRVRLYNNKGEEIVAGNPLYNQYISFAPKIDCQKQWVEVTLNLEDIVQIFNTINVDESKLHIDNEQYKQLLFYYEGLQDYFIWDATNSKWKFNGGKPEYQSMVKLIQLDTVEQILNNIETNLGDRPRISVNEYDILISYYKPWEDYFIFKKGQSGNQDYYEYISSLSTLEAMKKLEESNQNNQVKQILTTKIGNSLKANPIISTGDYNTLVHHNVSWSTYFDEIKNYKCFINSITSSGGQPSALDMMKAVAASNSDVLNILNTITESNPIIDEKSYSILITFDESWASQFKNCWEYTQGSIVLAEMKNNMKTINKVVEQEISNTSLLVPSPMYCQGIGSECFIVVEGFYKNQQTNIETVYWQQPIIIIQNQHESALLNEWNGNFIIDEENKYIMSAMLGAGYKNPDNTYNGVLMGDLAITELLDGSSSSRSVESRMVGLYGFHEGSQSFGFRVDGTAFMGKAGSGRIEFNGNKGIIQSGTYTASGGKAGMQIDLTNGLIDAYNFKLTSNRIFMNSEEEPYFKLRTFVKETGKPEEEKTLMYIGDTDYYLQSSDYKENILESTWDDLTGENPFATKFNKGVKIDLVNGTIYASPGKIEDSHISGLTIDTRGSNASSVVLAAGNNFALKGSGDLNLKGNWEIWTGERTDGAVCLSPIGVHHYYASQYTAEDLNDKDLLDKLKAAIDGGKDWIGALSGDVMHETTWEELSKVAIEFQTIKAIMGALIVGVVAALAGVGGLGFLELLTSFFESLGTGALWIKIADIERRLDSAGI